MEHQFISLFRLYSPFVPWNVALSSHSIWIALLLSHAYILMPIIIKGYLILWARCQYLLQAHLMFDHCVKAQSFSFLTNLLLLQSKILQMFKWKTRPVLLSFSFRYTNIGIQYVRSIEIGKGVLCSRTVFLNPSIFEDLSGISEFVFIFSLLHLF